MTTETTSRSIDYTRRLYDDVRAWYESADGKAQVVLAIDGAFLAFLTGTIFTAPAELRGIVAAFSVWTWLLLALMTVCLIASVVAAIYCLWSRIYSERSLREWVRAAEGERARSVQYAPETMWFFQMIAVHEKDRFGTTLRAVDDAFELDAMGSQIHILSGHVRKKHRAVNLGFVLAAMTLILFFFAGLSYLAQSV